jgi:hypothetical protein
VNGIGGFHLVPAGEVVVHFSPGIADGAAAALPVESRSTPLWSKSSCIAPNAASVYTSFADGNITSAQNHPLSLDPLPV